MSRETVQAAASTASMSACAARVMVLTSTVCMSSHMPSLVMTTLDDGERQWSLRQAAMKAPAPPQTAL